ncbi:FAD/NAD(P)-binding domain-containing protein [Aspergillus ellipticus CBS 707.79]|uniref:FAD/NAD(P)-binding domain-containing protein n=1 Tax=Aspergillus ellipticus CBS 707.79 TaxID=1448320 RepID=A0A319E1F0_9EURO|nr:FAD/NAD(P)-binding domain-containing protein [Aspergillus ellipticus CBS 707.79]
MSPTVLIIGCGVAGPVLALLLKQKGYHPIVLEKVRALSDAGASLMLQPNGMKVLSLINATPFLRTTNSLPLATLWHGTADGTTLGSSAFPSTYETTYGQPAMGIKRTALNLHLKDLVLSQGIPVHEGWQLTSMREHADSVTAEFANGESVTGAFLIGSDGIKASSRKILLQNDEGLPSFTGLVQIAGISKTDGRFGASMRNWYGEGVHVIAYPVSRDEVSWALTVREEKEVAESWGVESGRGLEERKMGLVGRLGGQFEDDVVQMVNAAERIISFGLFDRKELSPEQWFSTRCVLVGDAAHPTSPHLGQGANQAMEDCYHLSRLLPDAHAFDGSALEGVFREFVQLRQPRTSALVKEARRLGDEQRVVVGEERCRQRDARIKAAWSDPEQVVKGLDPLLKEPF